MGFVQVKNQSRLRKSRLSASEEGNSLIVLKELSSVVVSYVWHKLKHSAPPIKKIFIIIPVTDGVFLFKNHLGLEVTTRDW